MPGNEIRQDWTVTIIDRRTGVIYISAQNRGRFVTVTDPNSVYNFHVGQSVDYERDMEPYVRQTHPAEAGTLLPNPPYAVQPDRSEVPMDENKIMALGWLATNFPSTAALVPDGWGLAFPPTPEGRVACLVGPKGQLAIVRPGYGLNGGWRTMATHMATNLGPEHYSEWPTLYEYLKSTPDWTPSTVDDIPF